MKPGKIRDAFREAYGRRVRERSAYRGSSTEDVTRLSKQMGYTQAEIDAVPAGSNLGLGCGTPVARASIKAGETVLDLGSGAGFDCFLAAHRVGATGRVIGIDMTPEMVRQARTNAESGHYRNVEFRRGELEDLPVDDEVADLVISNCAIHLSPEKRRAFREAYRTLKPGGRTVIADLVLVKALPDFLRDGSEASGECFVAIIPKGAYLRAITEAGFRDVTVIDETRYPVPLIDFEDPTAQSILTEMQLTNGQTKEVGNKYLDVLSITVRGYKPARLAS